MKKYVFVDEVTKLVGSVVDELDSTFPNIPITQRYTEDFLRNCIAVDYATEVTIGMKYNPDTQQFEEVPPPTVDENPNIPIQPTTTYAQKLEELTKKNDILSAQLIAANEKSSILENCLVELAGEVYAKA